MCFACFVLTGCGRGGDGREGEGGEDLNGALVELVKGGKGGLVENAVFVVGMGT